MTLTPLDGSSGTPTHDEDGDGCTDYRELGDSKPAGGLRDPFNPYDYYDVNHDGAISTAVDILQVANAFGVGNARYVDYKDRGVTLGPNSWNKEGPNGSIDVPGDILGVAAQFGDSCAPGHAHNGTAFGPHPRTLGAAVTAGQGAPFALSVNTTAGYASSGQLLVDAETLTYDQSGGCGGLDPSTQFCVTGRGSGTPSGNDPADHSANAVVYPKP